MHLFPVCQAPLDYKLQEGLHFVYIALYCITNAWSSMEATHQVFVGEGMSECTRVDGEDSLRCIQLEVSPNSQSGQEKKCKCRV